MDKYFKFSFTVDESSIDNLNHVNNVTYLNWAQTVAGKHWDKISSDTINNTYVWVVIRHEVDYFSSAFLNDKIELKTWQINVLREGTDVLAKIDGKYSEKYSEKEILTSNDFSVYMNHDLSNGFFSSDREGGLGGDDIYNLTIQDEWTKASDHRMDLLQFEEIKAENSNPSNMGQPIAIK